MDKKDTVEDNIAKLVTLEDIMRCKIYPNPVVSVLNINYELKEDAKVSFDLYSLEGFLVRKVKAKLQKTGMYYENVDCSNLPSKNYVLRITANDFYINEVIIKK